jgi:hypothetical protein
MKASAILAAAVALQEFRVRQLAAYCGATPEEVEAALATAPGWIEPTGPQQWRVVEPDAIRTAVRSAETPESLQPTTEPATDAVSRARLIARLVVAEETLIECGTEESPALRQVMAATARNNVLQVLAQLTPEQGPWWNLEDPGPSWRTESFNSRIQAARETAQAEIALPRLRADFELASLTGREAAGEPVPADDLVRTAAWLRDVLKVIVDGRLDRLLQRFIDLAIGLAGPAGLGQPGASARTRLLVTLAWRRVRRAAELDARQASDRMLLILQQLQKERDKLAGRDTIGLYRVIEHLPDGLNRLVVYRDLLELLPSKMTCHHQKELLPDVVVEAVADSAASDHLAWIAGWLGDGLDQSPFDSESALIGQAAHVFNDVVHTATDMDASLILRGDQMRMQLLSLAKAPARK